MQKINILGTEYKLITRKISEDECLKRNNFAGYCAEHLHEIVIADMSEEEYFVDMTEEEKEAYRKSVLRHEIIHAYLNESGLSADAMNSNGSWAKNEEMVDWMAIQFPKIAETFLQLKIL